MLLVIRVIIETDKANGLPLWHRYNFLLLFLELGLLTCQVANDGLTWTSNEA